jgi:hypothetical protein
MHRVVDSIQHLPATVTSVDIIDPKHVAKGHIFEYVPANEVADSGAKVPAVP